MKEWYNTILLNNESSSINQIVNSHIGNNSILTADITIIQIQIDMWIHSIKSFSNLHVDIIRITLHKPS